MYFCSVFPTRSISIYLGKRTWYILFSGFNECEIGEGPLVLVHPFYFLLENGVTFEDKHGYIFLPNCIKSRVTITNKTESR